MSARNLYRHLNQKHLHITIGNYFSSFYSGPLLLSSQLPTFLLLTLPIFLSQSLQQYAPLPIFAVFLPQASYLYLLGARLHVQLHSRQASHHCSKWRLLFLGLILCLRDFVRHYTVCYRHCHNCQLLYCQFCRACDLNKDWGSQTCLPLLMG